MIDITGNENLDYLRVRLFQNLLKENLKLFQAEEKSQWEERKDLRYADEIQREINSKKHLKEQTMKEIE